MRPVLVMDPFLLSSSSISPFIKDSPFPSIHPSTPNRPCFLFLFYLPFYGIRFCKLYIRSFMNKERCSFSFRFVISLCIVIPTLPYSFFVVFDFGKTRIRDSLYKKNVSFSSFRFSPSRYLILLLFIYTFFFVAVRCSSLSSLIFRCRASLIIWQDSPISPLMRKTCCKSHSISETFK